MEAFVYCWMDAKTGMRYIGYHKGSVDDGYVSSSKHFMKEYDSRPDDFTRAILAQGTTDYCREKERELLKEVDAARNPIYYNKSNGDGHMWCLSHTEDTKQIMRKPKSDAHKAAMKKPKSEEHRRKISMARKGRSTGSPSEETRRKMSESRKKYLTPEVRQRLSLTLKGKTKKAEL